MSTFKTLIILILFAGCGGAAKQQSMPAAAAPAPENNGEATDALDSRATQIDELSSEIDRWSEQIGIRAATGAAQPDPTQTGCADLERKAECIDTCTIADSICSNSEKICVLAAELQERSADETCTESKTSCDRAKAACCKCNRG